MARFTDQFARHNPKLLQLHLRIPIWPDLVQREANSILAEFSGDFAIQVARPMEMQIERFANPASFNSLNKTWIWMQVKPRRPSKKAFESSNEIRNEFGDLNLLLAIFRRRERINFAEFASFARIEPWYCFAALALWKLIDAEDAMLGRTPHLLGGPLHATQNERDLYGAGLAMEAQSAISHALLSRLEPGRITEILQAQTGLATLQRKRLAKSGANGKMKKHLVLKKKVLTLARSRPFRTQDEAAIWISDQVKKSPTQQIPISTVKRYLREAGWKKNSCDFAQQTD